MKISEKDSMTLYSTNTDICPYCKGGGYIIKRKSTAHSKKVYGDDRLLDYAEPCPYCNGGFEHKAEEVKQRATIPDSYLNNLLGDFDWDIYVDAKGNKIDVSKQKEFITSFIDDFEKWSDVPLGLYINSKTRGSGKTFLASCICNEIIKKYACVTKFVSAIDLIDISKGDNDPLKPLKECRLLVLDDVGAKLNGQEWLNDILFSIIDYRYQHKLTMIITSNIPLKRLKIDDRLDSRIDKMTQNIPLPECSVRQLKANQDKLKLFKNLNLIKT